MTITFFPAEALVLEWALLQAVAYVRAASARNAVRVADLLMS
jgi:hypothetical protein